MPRSQVRRTSMRSSRVSLRPATTQVSVSGTPASTSAWRTCQPQAVATTSASAAGQLGHPPAGPGEQVQHAELGEHDLVPVGPGADDPGEPAHPVGERAGPGVDEAGGELVPRGVAGERRVGETGADAVVEPALELDEAGDEALDALVALALEVGGRRAAGSRRLVGVPARPASAVAGERARRGRGEPAHGRTPSGATPAGTCPSTHITSRARACLHGCERLGHEHRHAAWTWSTIVS